MVFSLANDIGVKTGGSGDRGGMEDDIVKALDELGDSTGAFVCSLLK